MLHFLDGHNYKNLGAALFFFCLSALKENFTRFAAYFFSVRYAVILLSLHLSVNVS